MGRHFAAFGLAGFVTFGLFYLMQALIAAEGELDDAAKRRVIDFVRLKKEENVDEKKRKLPDKKPPEEPPPPPDLNLAQNNRPDQMDGESLGIFDSSLDLGEGVGLGQGAGDSDIIPLVRVDPMYPPSATQRGIEGWVDVEFTISKAGTVKNPKILRYHPTRVFNRSALKAIRKWKYNPKIEEGVAVERPGVKVRLTFSLSQA